MTDSARQMQSILVIPIEASPAITRPLLKIDPSLLEKSRAILLPDNDDLYNDVGPLIKSGANLLLPFLQAVAKELPPSILEVLGFDFVARQENLPKMNLETRRFHSDLSSLPMPSAFAGSEIVATEYWTPFQGNFHHLVLHFKCNYGPTNLRNIAAVSNLLGNPLHTILNRYFVAENSPSDQIAHVSRKGILINVIESDKTEITIEDQSVFIFSNDFDNDVAIAQTRYLTQALLFSHLRAELHKIQTSTNAIHKLSDLELEESESLLFNLRRKWLWPRIFIKDIPHGVYKSHLDSLAIEPLFQTLLLDIKSELRIRDRKLQKENLALMREASKRERKFALSLGGFAVSSLISSWWNITGFTLNNAISILIGVVIASLGFVTFWHFSNRKIK